MVFSTRDNPWTLGRGQWAGNTADYLNGFIDEVRFSDTALGTGEFLNAIPEPGTYALLAGLLGLGFVALRRRKA